MGFDVWWTIEGISLNICCLDNGGLENLIVSNDNRDVCLIITFEKCERNRVLYSSVMITVKCCTINKNVYLTKFKNYTLIVELYLQSCNR